MSYKLIYWNLRGRGSPIRYIFALAEQEYVDERIEYEEADFGIGKEWLETKPKLLWGTLPELEHDGNRLCQTPAIVRYLGAKFGLAGKTDTDKAYIDMLMSCLEDIVVIVERLIHSARKEELKEEESPKLHEWIKLFNTLLVNNYDVNGWLVGDTVTIADVYAYSYLPYLTGFYPNIFDNYPKLQALFKQFEELPQIAAWIDKRPETHH